MNLKTAVLAATVALAPIAVYAQTTIPAPPPTTTPAPAPTPAAPTAPKPNINQRKENQQNRIANGVKGGQLNAGQTAHLEHQEAGINHEEHGMRAQDNGHLTKQDRSTLKSQQNQESRRIYRDKHAGK